jgi:hypothetical protein
VTRVIFLHGPPAAGKYTIGKEHSALSGITLFHNHLLVDLLRTVFPFGSPLFIHHRERIWLDVIGDAVTAGTSLIFTFNPERSVSPEFPANLAARVEGAGGQITFVEISCPDQELEQRMEDRTRSNKLNSLVLYRQLRDEGAFEYPPIASEFVVDSSDASPREAAIGILMALGLPRAAP